MAQVAFGSVSGSGGGTSLEGMSASNGILMLSGELTGGPLKTSASRLSAAYGASSSATSPAVPMRSSARLANIRSRMLATSHRGIPWPGSTFPAPGPRRGIRPRWGGTTARPPASREGIAGWLAHSRVGEPAESSAPPTDVIEHAGPGRRRPCARARVAHPSCTVPFGRCCRRMALRP